MAICNKSIFSQFSSISSTIRWIKNVPFVSTLYEKWSLKVECQNKSSQYAAWNLDSCPDSPPESLKIFISKLPLQATVMNILGFDLIPGHFSEQKINLNLCTSNFLWSWVNIPSESPWDMMQTINDLYPSLEEFNLFTVWFRILFNFANETFLSTLTSYPNVIRHSVNLASSSSVPFLSGVVLGFWNFLLLTMRQ